MDLENSEKVTRIIELLTLLRAPNDVEKISRARKPGYMEMFSRFPEDLSKALYTAITPEDNDMHEALLCACTWLAETEQKLEKAGDKIDMLQKQKTTHDAQLSGQRDRMVILEGRLNSHIGRTDVLTNQLAGMQEQNISQSKAHVRLNDRLDIHYENMNQVLEKLAKMDERMQGRLGRIDGPPMTTQVVKHLESGQAILDKSLGILNDRIAGVQEKVSGLGIKLAAQENTSSLHDRQIISQSKVTVELKDRADIHSQNATDQRERMNVLSDRLSSQVNRADGQAMSIVDLKTRVSSLEKVFVSVPSTQEKQP